MLVAALGAVAWMVVAFFLAQRLEEEFGGQAVKQETHGATAQHVAAVKGMLCPPSGETLDDVGGLSHAKKALRRSVLLPLRYPSIFFSGPPPIRPPRGVLLHGPPGTGKTMLARALASESGANFVCVSSSTLEDKWWGESAKLIQATFHVARTELQPCIVFFDEIDGMGRSRSEHDQACVYSFKTELLRNLDGAETGHREAAVVVLACTNCAHALDPALRRRLPLRVEVGLPTEADRLAILRRLCPREPTYDKDEKGKRVHVLQQVAQWTAGKTGSDLASYHSDASSMRMQDADVERMIKDGVRDGETLLSQVGGLKLRHWRRAIFPSATR